MFSFRTDGDTTTIGFDLHLAIESDWLTLSGGVFTFADTLTVDISSDTVTICSAHRFDPAHIGFFGAEPVNQPVVSGETVEARLGSTIAALVALGLVSAGP